MNDHVTTFAQMQARILEFVNARDWGQFHSPKNLSMALSAETGELMEQFLWCDVEESKNMVLDPKKRMNIADEIADVMIYALQFARVSQIDIVSAMEAKMAKNALKYPVEKSRGSSTKYSEL